MNLLAFESKPLYTKWITLFFIFAGVFAVEKVVNQRSLNTHLGYTSHSSVPIGSPDTTVKIFLLLIDGMPYRVAMDSSIMPHTLKLRRNSTYAKVKTTFEAYSSSAIRAAFSGENQNSIFDVFYNFNHNNTLQINSIFKELHKQKFDVTIYSYGHFNQFGTEYFNAKYLETNGNYLNADKLIPETAFADFKNSSSNLVIAHYETTDWAGHEFGTLAPKYLKVYSRIDSLIGFFSSNLNEKEYFIIIGDHGMSIEGEHKTGMDIPTYLSVTGKDIKANTNLGTIDITQLKDLLALLFKLPINHYQANTHAIINAFNSLNDESIVTINSPTNEDDIDYWRLSLVVIPLVIFLVVGFKILQTDLNWSHFLTIVFLLGSLLFSDTEYKITCLLLSIVSILHYIKRTPLNIRFNGKYILLLATFTVFYITFQKIGFIKSSPTFVILVFSLLVLVNQIRVFVSKKDILKIFLSSLTILYLAFSYRWQFQSIQLNTLDSFYEIVIIYSLGISAKLYLFIKDVRNINQLLFPILGFIIALIPELHAINALPITEQHYFGLTLVLIISGLIISYLIEDHLLIRTSSILSLLFILLYHTFQIPIYHYLYFDLSLFSVFLFSRTIKRYTHHISEYLLSTVYFGFILLISSILINSTTNGIEWKFIYQWYSAVTVEKNILLFFPIVILKVGIPVLLYKFILKESFSQRFYYSVINTGQVYFITLLLGYVIIYGLTQDKIFFNSTIELFFTHYLAYLFY
ncbi:hypothetical protein EP331_10275 [bacterium]|nr:MAG: hypothetical protein EP331_10275 [bacterium]